jgi:hypothetical protein
MFAAPIILKSPPASLTIRRLLYDVLELMRIAEHKYGRVAEACAAKCPQSKREMYTQNDAEGMQINLQIFIAILQETVGGAAPTLPERSFAILRQYANQWEGNIPHAEGATLAQELAGLQLQLALDESERINGPTRFDALDKIMLAARYLLQAGVSSATILETDRLLAAIGAGRMPDMEEQRAWLAELEESYGLADPGDASRSSRGDASPSCRSGASARSAHDGSILP